jgi:hypothetical protein
LIGVVEEVGPTVQNLKRGDPNPTANDGTMFNQRVQGQ